MSLEEYQYHPRYSRSEYDDYLALERRSNRRAFGWLLFVAGCVVGLIYIVA